MAVCQFRPLEGDANRKNNTIQKFDHGFLFKLNTNYVCNMHRLKVIPNFLIVD
jgi:hypothetical protein